MAQSTSDAIVSAAQEYFRAQLSKSLELAFLIPKDPALDADTEIAGAMQLAARYRGELAQQHFSPSVRSDAEELLKTAGVKFTSKVSEEFRFACSVVLRANIENAKAHAEQLAGNYAVSSDPLLAGIFAKELPPIPGETPKSNALPTFQEVADEFLKVKNKDWVAKTFVDVKRVISIASELIGSDKPMKAVTTDDVKRIRDTLSSVPPNYAKSAGAKGLSVKQAIAANASGKSLSAKTQGKYFALFKQLMIWARDEEYVDKVPGNNIKVVGTKKIAPGEQRHPYSTDQLAAILASPIYAGCKSEDCRHKSGKVLIHDAYFWVPIIALYSGMRLGEILQLLKSDVKQENGIWYFDVRSGEGKSLKTASSKRRVPIHSVLLQLGLLGLVKTGTPTGRLFPEIKKGADGYASHNFSKWWGRYAARVGFKTDRTTFHSFRHNFADALRASNAPEYTSKTLMGHADNSVHGGYGSGPSLPALKEAIDKIIYPMDLSELKSG